ncbi:YARHG domain-containing protein [Candidatus Uhrbacteria bacterium]|nr:YARHG domain-containing protein [Candidatus Uhrbacteria bacterium]
MAHRLSTTNRRLAFFLLVPIVALVVLAFGFYVEAQACEEPDVYVQELVEHARKHELLPYHDSLEAFLEVYKEGRCDVLWQSRNAIYAGHGYAFVTARAQEWVKQYSWYRRDQSITEKTVKLNETDIANRDYVLQLEKKHSCN